MKIRGIFLSFVILLAWTAIPASAHRLDECLEAARLSVDTSQVGIELDITPGAAVASGVFNSIDADHDGEVSRAEQEASARQVIRSLVLSVDGRNVPVTLVDFHFPALSEMKLGVGIISLRATAGLRSAGTGHHQLSFLNTHQFGSSVYLVNALVPSSPRIQLGDQQRDVAQHGMKLDYTVAADPPPVWTWAMLAGLVLAARLYLKRHLHRRLHQRRAAPACETSPEYVREL